jgi:hypothetical protein
MAGTSPAMTGGGIQSGFTNELPTATAMRIATSLDKNRKYGISFSISRTSSLAACRRLMT